MKKTIQAISTKFIVLSIGAITLFSCVSNPDSPGLEFMPDMYRGPAIEPYVDYGMVKGERDADLQSLLSAKHPPISTIPYYGKHENLSLYLPYTREANKFANKTHGLLASDGWNLSDEAGGDYFASAADKNPIDLTEYNKKAVFDHGKELYEINCVHCHGPEGDGKGTMVKNGSYAGVPDYLNLKSLADGQVFYSIYYGKGMMGAHASWLNKEEIWTLVHYINKFRFDDYGPASIQKETAAADSTSTSESLDSTDVKGAEK